MRPAALATPALVAAAVLATALTIGAADPPPARAGVVGVLCSAAGDLSPLAGTACSVGSKVVSIGGKLLGDGGTVARAAGLAATAVAVWVGARAALRLAAGAISSATRPRLQSAWFSASYWRVAAIAALLTLPFLFAAAVQSLLRGDLSLLLRAVLGYLPLAMLAVAIATPLCMLALSATDEMSALVGAAGLGGAARFLDEIDRVGAITAVAGAPFLAIAIGLLMIAGALAVGLELIVREAAVYVVVLMLPLAFAAMVWPARRALAARLVELLVALILSKFVIVAVLGLAGAGLWHLGHGRLQTLLAAIALLGLAVFSPLALMRLIPLTELAASTGGRQTLWAAGAGPAAAVALADAAVRPLTPEPASLDLPASLERPPLPPASHSGPPAANDSGPTAGGHSGLTAADDRGPTAASLIADSGAQPSAARSVGDRGSPLAPQSPPTSGAERLRTQAPAGARQRSADGQRVLEDEPWWTDPDAISTEQLMLADPSPGALFTGPGATAAAAALSGPQPPPVLEDHAQSPPGLEDGAPPPSAPGEPRLQRDGAAPPPHGGPAATNRQGAG